MKSKYYMDYDNRNRCSVFNARRLTRYVYRKSGIIIDKFYYFGEKRVRAYKIEKDKEISGWYKCTYLEMIRKGDYGYGEVFDLDAMAPYDREETIFIGDLCEK